MLQPRQRVTPKNSQRPLAPEFSIEIIRNFEELEQIRKFWEKVQWHPFTDIDYFTKFAHAHEGFIEPYVMVLKRGDLPVTLMIGWLQQKSLNLKIGYKTVFKPNVRFLHIEYAGVLGDASHSNSEMLIKHIMNFLAKNEADFAYFKFIKQDAPIFQLAMRMPSFLCRDYHPFINPHWAICMPDCFDDFIARFSPTKRKKMRRQNNLINRRFKDNVVVKCFRAKDDLETAFRDLETIASRTYQRGLMVGYDDSAQTHKEFIFAAERHWLRIYILYLNGVPAAYTTGYVYGKTYVGLAQGYDPAFKDYSPGIFTVLREIESLCCEGSIEIYDFGYGDAFYKRQFSEKKWNDAEVYVFAPTLKGVQLNFMRSLIAIVDKSIKIVLSHVNMLDWVKKRWRQKMIPTEG